MSEKYLVDRVIGTKVCRKCGYPVSVESYSIPEAKNKLERHITCHNSYCMRDYKKCEYNVFSDPKFEVKMKPYKEWVKPLMRRMSK